MSPFTVTVVVPDAEKESAFLQRVVQSALQVYRKNHEMVDKVNVDTDLAKATDVLRTTPRLKVC